MKERRRSPRLLTTPESTKPVNLAQNLKQTIKDICRVEGKTADIVHSDTDRHFTVLPMDRDGSAMSNHDLKHISESVKDLIERQGLAGGVSVRQHERSLRIKVL
tara:strand:- start:545 stop:856 length:312 start_codon:yes stop_codon:yes gene_type:complete